MSEAKGSDVRAQKRKLFGESVEFKELAERCGTYEFEAHGAEILKWMQERVQAAAVEMRERCAKHVEGLKYPYPVLSTQGMLEHIVQRLRALPIPTNAYDAALGARDDIFKWLLGENGEFAARPEGGGAYWWRTELRQRLAALTQPAPERKEK